MAAAKELVNRVLGRPAQALPEEPESQTLRLVLEVPDGSGGS